MLFTIIAIYAATLPLVDIINSCSYADIID